RTDERQVELARRIEHARDQLVPTALIRRIHCFGTDYQQPQLLLIYKLRHTQGDPASDRCGSCQHRGCNAQRNIAQMRHARSHRKLGDQTRPRLMTQYQWTRHIYSVHSMPTTAPVMHVASVPAKMDLRPSATTSPRRSGTIAVKPPIRMP